MDFFTWPLMALYVVISTALVLYGLNAYVLIFLFKRNYKRKQQEQKERLDITPRASQRQR